MNEEETTAATTTERREKESVERPFEETPPVETNRRPATCTLYRWYPPLLVLSTVMAGVFCVLYVTKPVFLEAPNPERADQLNVRVYAEQIAEAGQPAAPQSAQPAAASIMPAHLDPGLSSVPRRVESPAVADQNEPDVAQLQPMNVRRNSKPLFQPLKPEEMPPPKAVAIKEPVKATAPVSAEEPPAIAAAEPVEEAPKETAEETEEGSIAVATKEELETVVEEFPGTPDDGDDLVADAEETAEDQEQAPDGPTMRASLLGEFYVADSDESGSSTGKAGSSTAMANQMD